MITTSTTGAALTPAFTGLMEESWLDQALKPVNEILFCRQISEVWYNRDVSALWLDMEDIDKRLAAQYGVSEGTEVSFTFRNTPITTLSVSYFGGTDLEVIDTTFGEDFSLAVDDWIAISSYDNTEYRRITAIWPQRIRLSLALDNTYPAGTNQEDTEIRFLFVREPTADRLSPTDFNNGWLVVKTGFLPLSERVYSYIGQVSASQVTPQDTITITAQDRVKSLVDHKFTQRVEFDDRGVASVPMPDPLNTGSGEISDVTYNPRKEPDALTTEKWTITYVQANTPFNGISYDTSGWTVSGSVTGVDSRQRLPDRTKTNRFLASGSLKPENAKDRRWVIDLLGGVGWSVTIKEGDTKFAAGDNFVFWTQASGTVAAVKGGAHATNEIDTANLTALNPSYICEYLVKDLLALEHENPETDPPSTALFNAASLTTVRSLAQDNYTECRGSFPAGTRAIEVIDDALKPVLGWLYTTEDDHLALFYYSPFMLASPTVFNFAADITNATNRPMNLRSIIRQPLSIESVKNSVEFQYDLSDEQDSITIEDIPSQTEYGNRELVIRAEDFSEYKIQTRFQISESSARNAANRILIRTKDPLEKFLLECHPHALLLELGDTPKLFARNVQVANQRVWITRITKNLKRREQVVQIICENAVHLNGKFFEWQNSPPATVTDIWDSSGFVGTEGQGRLLWWGDDAQTVQLDAIGNNDGDYDAKLGKPDEWDSYVERLYQWW